MESLKIIFTPETGQVAITSANPFEAAAAAEIVEAAAYINKLSVNLDYVASDVDRTRVAIGDPTYYLFFEPADEAAVNVVLDLAYEYGTSGIAGVLELEPYLTAYLQIAGKTGFDGKFNSAAMDEALKTITVEPFYDSVAAEDALPAGPGEPLAAKEAGIPRWAIVSLVTVAVVGGLSWFILRG